MHQTLLYFKLSKIRSCIFAKLDPDLQLEAEISLVGSREQIKAVC